MKIYSVFHMKTETNPPSVICRIFFFHSDFFYVLIVGVEVY